MMREGTEEILKGKISYFKPYLGEKIGEYINLRTLPHFQLCMPFVFDCGVNWEG